MESMESLKLRPLKWYPRPWSRITLLFISQTTKSAWKVLSFKKRLRGKNFQPCSVMKLSNQSVSTWSERLTRMSELVSNNFNSPCRRRSYFYWQSFHNVKFYFKKILWNRVRLCSQVPSGLCRSLVRTWITLPFLPHAFINFHPSLSTSNLT